MGRFVAFGVGLCLITLSSAAAAAASAASGALPPAPSQNAGLPDDPNAPLPPPPPPPPQASPSPPAGAAAPAAAAPTAPSVAPLPGYPPPGYAYYYPPPAPRATERFPDNAAVSSSPFIDALAGSLSWQNRVSQSLNAGLQVGLYAAGRVRLALSALLPTATLNDRYYGAYPDYSSPGASYYYRQPSKAATLLIGASVGVVAVSTKSFVLAPGVVFGRTDVSDYGSSLGASLPFEWVTGTGLRLGFELDLGRAFGGKAHLQCMTGVSAGGSCASGPVLSQDRPSGTSLSLAFQLGFGFGHPATLAPDPSAAPAYLPSAPPAPSPPSAPPAPPAPSPPSAPPAPSLPPPAEHG